MRYIDQAGRIVPAHRALHRGQILPGFRTVDSDVLGDGESVGFDMAFMDSKPRSHGSITIHDQCKAVRDLVRDARWLPSLPPTAARSTNAAPASAPATVDAATRNALRMARYS